MARAAKKVAERVAAEADALADYNAKRDFARTAEPAGERGEAGGRTFMVQKHDATRLHWDLRLAMEGVLKSWAVTRGPSLDPNDKRLAVRTEDHPLSYATFEGTIPKGEYGGGTVMLWDRGTWEPYGGKDPVKTIKEGHVHVILHGERMKGEWLLIRLKPRAGEKRENWLLRKIDDEHAGASGGLVDTALTSVATGRTMVEIAEGADVTVSAKSPQKAKPKPKATWSSRKKGGALPAFRDVQLATLVDHVPGGTGWLHEVKYDGYRALLSVSGGEVRAYTRHGLDWTDRFGPVVEAVAALDLPPCLLDGEVVALDKDGRPNFSALQSALKSGAPLHYFAFDLLEQDGEDLTGLSNRDRKERLATLLEGASEPIHYAEHIETSGEALYESLCREGYEGIVSKRADAPYRGTRSRSWLKTKCTRRQEFVILGYVESDKKGRDLRSLALGVNEDGTLRYAGRVGTGFDADTRDMLMREFRPLARKTPAGDVPRAAARGVTWLRPTLVAEVAYAEFTADGVVRHASFLGLREDKAAKEVVAERPVKAPDAKPFGVAITHPDRVVFAGDGSTKGDLAAYYAQVAEPMLAWLGNRPVSLVRCPQGRGKHCFFQKHDAGNFGGKVGHVPIREKDGSTEDYLVVDDGEGLLTCVQMGTIEFHGWGAPASDVEHPDRLVFDLDPDEGLDFAAVRHAAIELRDLLGELGLASFPMVSGGKGVHVVVPLDGSRDWVAVKDFADRFSRAVAQAHPERYTANMRKSERKGRIFLDWLRNQRGATAVLPYSVRARERPSVAAPVTWDELAALEQAAPYTIADVAELLVRADGAVLRDWGRADQALPDL
ncbi:ATP-dependent DNA ligase LigD phosphoesterase module /ATP-dependent DNA ligase LigD polymerase module [Sphingomonas guangdongensis]|uniref:DNA ligase (ATP) n=1 Tax=Sphingomonas guangdongensis TaxID=1141890 RepID=A0A285QDK7_9SPHN|nr:DNA ligase D [Sphingomonas guangdongensis]SOB80030.1 ATP-dependent DNA ligase LigD phosphoesterase module /ATP-dependent DNA ligase LigD polymerase module [Sphingomonas guangdongensis]